MKSLDMPELNTLEDLKNVMKAQLEMQAQQQYNQTVENEVMNKLIADCEVEVEEADVNKSRY